MIKINFMPFAFMQCMADLTLLMERLLLDLSGLYVFDFFVP